MLSTRHIENYVANITAINANELADPSGLAVKGVGLRPVASWDCGFETRRDMDVCLL